MRAAWIGLLLSGFALADPPPGGSPPPVNCDNRSPLAAAELADGRYVGLEPITVFLGMDRGEKGTKWFHEVVITISGGKASSDESPIEYVRGVRYESASDGGFYHYEGCLRAVGDHYTVEMPSSRLATASP